MVSQFDHFFSVEALRYDYKCLLAEKYDYIGERTYLPPGADRKDKEEFEKQLDQHLRAINRKVLQGRWAFSPFLETYVPKPSGGTRTISLSTIRDTLVQRALYQYLYPSIDLFLSDGSVAYRKQKGAHLAARKIKNAFSNGYTFILDADIEKFFDSVDHDQLMNLLSGVAIDSRAAGLLYKFVTAPRITPEDKESADKSRPRSKYPETPRYIGLPQGGVLSGMLANYYLCHLDRKIEDTGNVLVRYADDFVVCCPTIDDVAEVRQVSSQALDDLELRLHPTKTEERTASDGVDFVGFTIDKHAIRIKRENVARFKDRIRKVIDSHRVYFSKWEENIERLIRRLRYKIEGPAEELREHLEEINPYQKSWIGYYRIVDDHSQIKKLDHWLRTQISKYSWQVHGVKIKATDMRSMGLPSLFATYWRSRK